MFQQHGSLCLGSYKLCISWFAEDTLEQALAKCIAAIEQMYPWQLGVTLAVGAGGDALTVLGAESQGKTRANSALKTLQFDSESLALALPAFCLTIKFPDNDENKATLDSILPEIMGAIAQLVKIYGRIGDLERVAERFDFAFRGANDGIWDWNLLTNEVYFSPRWKSMLGYADDELPSILDSWRNNVHPDDLDGAMARVQTYLAGSSADYEVEFRMRHKDGRYIPILSRGYAIRDEKGHAIRFVGTHVDISVRKNLEAQFCSVFDGSGDALLIVNGESILYANAESRETFGQSLVNMKISTWIAKASMSEDGLVIPASCGLQYWIDRGFTAPHTVFEWKFRAQNGTTFDAEVVITAMTLDGKSALLLSMRDITARKGAEKLLAQRYKALKIANDDLKCAQDQLLQSEKMASVGQLAAGVAHEINNPVGYVNSNLATLSDYVNGFIEVLNGYRSICQKHLPAPELEKLAEMEARADVDFFISDVPKLLTESKHGLDRVRKIVRDLREFSHVDAQEWEVADVHAGLESTLNIVHNEIKYKAEVVKDFGEVPPFFCLASQLNQVFLNLFVNAAHAMTENGRLTINTRCIDERVIIEVSDTGCGIPAGLRKRIFEPFFTTKPVGKGTGLGLSLAYGIVKKHRGEISVTSEEGVGTTFRIDLPLILTAEQWQEAFGQINVKADAVV